MLKVKPVFRCEDHHKNAFNHSTCLLTISVGQEVHEAEKFITTLSLVEESFQACIMVVDDTLQRHTMALEVNAPRGDDLMHDSLQAGDAWLERNRPYFSQMKNLVKIIRWDHWLQHEKFITTKERLRTLYFTDSHYHTRLDETINQFLTRYSCRKPDHNYLEDEWAKGLCLEYLLEECAAMCLWPELQCHFEVYPGHRNAAMDETHKRFVLPQHSELLHAVRVKFKSRKQLAPQKFEIFSTHNDTMPT